MSQLEREPLALSRNQLMARLHRALRLVEQRFRGRLGRGELLARIARLLRLVRSAKGLRTLLLTAIRCAPSLGIICSLLALTCVIFATIGMSLCEPCAAGYYQDQTGQSACIKCNPGS